MRDEFEKWAALDGVWNLEIVDGEYRSPAMQLAWEAWQAAAHSRIDCSTCSNRGRIDGLSQETHCDHCLHQEKFRTNHYAPND